MILAALNGHGLGVILGDYVLFWPGVMVALVVATGSSGRIARALNRPWMFAFGLVFSVGLIAAATLTPSRDALLFGVPGSGSCDLSQVAPPSLGELRSLNETSLNVFLFIPLGLTVGFTAGPRQTLPFLAASIAVPFAIEGIQLVVTPLGRACQSVDVVDNLTGLALGLAIAVIASTTASLVRRVRLGSGDLSEPRS